MCVCVCVCVCMCLCMCVCISKQINIYFQLYTRNLQFQWR